MLSMHALNKSIVMTLPLQAIKILKLINDVDVCLEQDNQVQWAWKAGHQAECQNQDEKWYEPKAKDEPSTSTTAGNNKESNNHNSSDSTSSVICEGDTRPSQIRKKFVLKWAYQCIFLCCCWHFHALPILWQVCQCVRIVFSRVYKVNFL